MKKLIYLLSATFLILQSCSSGDSSGSNEAANVVLIKSIVSSDGETIFSYEGTKLIKSTFGREYTKFTYSGDFITKIEFFDANNESLQRDEFTYSSNKLTQFKLYSADFGLEGLYNYNYNADGSVTISGTEYNGVNLVDEGVIGKIYFDTSGNKIKEEEIVKNAVISTKYFTYDTKNSPHKNITGLKYLNINGSFFSGNNLLSEKYSLIGSSQIFTDIVNTYQYNNQDYPISNISVENGKSTQESFYY